MKTDLYDKTGKVVGVVDLPESIFKRHWNPDLVHQAIRTQLANRRHPIAHTKDRGHVSGGGKKPWAQKHTGRARHGSTRSPIWKGGGVSFGPTNEKNFSLKINKKMRQVALFTALSRQLIDGVIKVIDSIKIDSPKTKIFINEFKNFLNKKSTLVIPSREEKNIGKASLNIKKLKTVSPESLNVYDLLKFQQILIDKNAIKEIENHYKKIRG